VQTASTIAAALERFHQERFDLVLSDVMLPDGKGPDLIFQLLQERPGLRAVLITGYTARNLDWEPIQKAGFPILQKPFAAEELLSQVRALLG